MNFLRNVGKRRARAGIRARHASVADAGEEHGDHGNQDRGDDMSVAAFGEHAEYGHRRDRLNHDHAVQNQIPERERAAQAGSGAVCGWGDFVAQ